MRPIAPNSTSNRRRIAWLALLPLVASTGCQPTPSFSIVGSFFPDWVFCCLTGIVLALVIYRLFVALKIESEVQPGVLVYPCIALSCAVTLWLLFFG
jgi:hypothetical protein